MPVGADCVENMSGTVEKMVRSCCCITRINFHQEDGLGHQFPGKDFHFRIRITGQVQYVQCLGPGRTPADSQLL